MQSVGATSGRSRATRSERLLRNVCASFLAAALSFATPLRAEAAPETPTPEQFQTASALFEKGSELFEAGKFDAAMEEFKKSYATVPSPNSHLYIARCLAALNQPRQAYAEFDDVVAEADARVNEGERKYVDTRDSAKSERDELASQLGLVTVRVPPGDESATLRIGGTAIAADRRTKMLPVEPGTSQVVLERPGQAPVTKSITIAAGERQEVVFEEATPSDASANLPEGESETSNESTEASGLQKLRPYAYLSGGVGVAGLVVFTIAGTMSRSTFSDLEERCGGPCPAGRTFEDDISKGKSEQTLANVGLVVGAVGIATGVTLFLLSRQSDPQKAAARAWSSPRATGLAVPF